MREQGSAGLGLTVSKKFDTKEQAEAAVKQLRSASFREEDIRLWQHRSFAAKYEDRLERTMEGLLAGGVIAGLIGFLVVASINWVENESIANETTAGATLIAAVAGAVVTAILVNIISTKVAFSHPHHVEPDEPPSVVTVRVGDKEDEAKRVFAAAS